VEPRRLLEVGLAVEEDRQAELAGVEHPLGVLGRPRLVAAVQLPVPEPEEEQEPDQQAEEQRGRGEAAREPEPAVSREAQASEWPHHQAGIPRWPGSCSRRYSSHVASSSAWVPTATIRPASITTIRSAISSVCSRCVIRNVVRTFAGGGAAAPAAPGSASGPGTPLTNSFSVA